MWFGAKHDSSEPADRPRRVLIISASMGAGHDGAARELATRLRAAGHEAVVKDFLQSGPLKIGSALRSGYEFELKHVPSAYDATYRLWYKVPWLCPVIAWFVATLSHRRVLRWVRSLRADVVVSTYPLSTLCLGRMRRNGRLRVPAVNFITDFGVHPLWVHKGIDINLAVHQGPAAMAAERTGRPSIGCGPVVSAAFQPVDEAGRSLARAKFGIQPGDRAVLIVAGSWGIGSLDETLQAVLGAGSYLPVVVCGRDARLRERVEAAADEGGRRAVVLGWTDRMPQLMAASDALVENAGGLTSLEALRVGLPVVSFQPIAGHGKENTSAMADAGVSRLALDRAGLAGALAAVTAPGPVRDEQVARGHAMFAEDSAALVLAAAGDTSIIRAPSRRQTVARVATRIGATTTLVAALAWGGLTTGVDVAAAEGAGVAHAAPGAGQVAYVGVRLTDAELTDPTVAAQLKALDASAIVDEATALVQLGAVQALAREGIDVESGGRGEERSPDGSVVRPPIWTRAADDAGAGQQLALLTGEPVRVFLPGRRVNAFDLMDCSADHVTLALADHSVSADDVEGPIPFTAREIFVLNGLHASPAQLSSLLTQAQEELSAHGLKAVPLSELS